jgi:hypothetical protein
MIGANRILRGVAITNPCSDPELGEREVVMRRRVVERALEFLEADVEAGTVWELETVRA